MTPDSIGQAMALIERGEIDAFSFDVFDTFVLRRTTAPDGVIERAFDFAPIPQRHRHAVESFIQHRYLAEYKSRLRRAGNGQPMDSGIDEIYSYFPTHVFGLPAEARAALAAAEFQAELDLLLVNRDIFEIYRAARARGIRTGFLSDTYWSGSQLRALLQHVAPGIEIDFLYASCDHGWSKAAGLFKPYLAEQGLDPARAAHIGDNITADVHVPGTLGLATVHYPQAPAWMGEVMQRETLQIRLMQAERSGLRRRCDNGLTVLRRLALARLGEAAAPDQIGAVGIVGPVLVAFNRLIESRRAELEAEGRTVKVLFLGRDGYLPHKLWKALGGGPADYVEISRRVALVASADTVVPLQKFFAGMLRVNAESVRSMLKTDTAAFSAFFAGFPDGVCTGLEMAAALPTLIPPDEMRALSAELRDKMLTYLRANVDGFDACTDFLLVDVGYSGTIQRAMRDLFDCAGLTKGLHGAYVLSVDDNFIDFAANDSVCSLIDDSVMSPMSKRALLRNISLFERFCAAPWASVLSYEGATVVREDEVRSADQVAFSDRMQALILDFAELYRSVRSDWAVDPFAQVEDAQVWGATLLCRFLMLPTAAEQAMFGPVQIDVNLGSREIVPVIDTAYVERLMGTMPFPKVCSVPMPPMWLAGSIATVSPFAGYAYALAGFGLIPDDMLNDRPAGEIDVVFIQGETVETCLPIGLNQTGFGDLRLRIPVLQKHYGARIAVPLARLGQSGVVRSLVHQEGDGSATTLNDRQVRPMPLSGIDGFGANLHGGYFRATADDAHLILTAPPSTFPLSILTLTVTPLDRDVRPS